MFRCVHSPNHKLKLNLTLLVHWDVLVVKTMSSILKWRDYISNPNTICCLRIINLLDWVQGNLSSIYFFYFSIFHSVRSAEQFFINYLKVYSLFDVYSTFCILLLVGIKGNNLVSQFNNSLQALPCFIYFSTFFHGWNVLMKSFTGLITYCSTDCQKET